LISKLAGSDKLHVNGHLTSVMVTADWACCGAEGTAGKVAMPANSNVKISFIW
jgi:hypothetical protein